MGFILCAGLFYGQTQDIVSTALATTPCLPMSLAFMVTVFWLAFWERKHFVDILEAAGLRTGGCTCGDLSNTHPLSKLGKLVLETKDELCDSTRDLVRELVHSGGSSRLGGSSSNAEVGAGVGGGFKGGEEIDDHQLEGYWNAVLSEMPLVPEADPTIVKSDVPSIEPPDLFVCELLGMVSDAMAQVDPGTGALVWRNACFDQLTQRVGGGDAWAGQRLLYSQFLQHVPRSGEEHLGVCTVGESGVPSLRLRSSVRLLESGDFPTTVLWVIKSMDLTDQPVPEPQCYLQQMAPKQQCCLPEQDPAGHNLLPYVELSEPLIDQSPPEELHEHPKAADYPDPTVRVQSGEGQRRRSVLLWRRYGRKSMNQASDSDSADRMVERIYFKCCKPGCGARLRVDVDRITGEQLSVTAAGSHNHSVEIVETRAIDLA
eukprot:TRINITY_DN279_c0_g1_i5.p1 TRINITY_DN279_c0_g1~~TRINITY_DN279_c0_g1_i5.p1  ORF type:complete len:430 (-),score=63.02 TRINITY_DN279_c0_g1_i5:351-1640(-)